MAVAAIIGGVVHPREVQAHAPVEQGPPARGERRALAGPAVDRAAQDGAALDRAAQDGAAVGRAALDGAALDRSALDGAALDRSALGRPVLDPSTVVPGPRLWEPSQPSQGAPGRSLLEVRLREEARRQLTPQDLAALAERAASFIEGARWNGRHLVLAPGWELAPRPGTMHNGAASSLFMPREGRLGSVIIDRDLDADRAEQLIARHGAYVAARLRYPEAEAQRRADVAELAVWIDQAFVGRRPQDPEWRARVACELSERLAAVHLDVRNRSDAILLGRARLLAFVTNPAYRRREAGIPGGVRIAGTDTVMDPDLPSRERDTGHIMASGEDPQTHLSFGPVMNFAQTHPAIRARFARLREAGAETRTVPVGDTPPGGPFRGAAPMLNTSRPGMLYPRAVDPYLQQTPHFEYQFDPAFIDPAAFAAAVAQALQHEAEAPAAVPYVLATSRAPLQDVVHASNCVTRLAAVLRTMRTASGQPVLGEDDLALLGLGPGGEATPGRDVRPQDLFDLLRFKEASLAA